VSECACCSCARQMRSTHPGSRSSLMTLLVIQSHLCVQGGTPQCPAPLRALPLRDQGIWSSNLAVTQQERKSNGHFSLSAPTTSPHLTSPSWGGSVQQQTLQSLRTSAVRTTRACHRGGTEQSITLGPLPPLTPQGHHLHDPFLLERCKKGV